MELPQTLIENSIARGTILHSTMFKNIDHGKFFVIVGVSEEYVAGFFFINSNINKYIEGKPEQLAMQYPMRHADYPFLRYDSFLSATNIERIPVAHIAETMRDGVTKVVGEMRKDHLSQLLEKARDSILFSKWQKKTFLY